MIKARENPFRTERIESRLTFHPEWLGETWSAILNRWDSLGRQVAIVGPHGSGKTTFLDAIQPRLCERGHEVQRVTIRSPESNALPSIDPSAVVLIDACGLSPQFQRNYFRRWRLSREIQSRLSHCKGVIETRHRIGRRPTLLRTHTTEQMLRQCIDTI